ALLDDAPERDASANVEMQRIPHDDEHAVAARLDEPAVQPQRLIDITLGIVRLEGRIHVLHETFELFDDARLARNGELHRTRFERGAQLIGFAHLLEVGAAHARAAIALRHHEPRAFELAQRFADRRLTHVELAREDELLQLRSRRVCAIENARDENVADAIAHASALQCRLAHAPSDRYRLHHNAGLSSWSRVQPPPIARTS